MSVNTLVTLRGDVIGRVLPVENNDYAARGMALLDSLASRLPLEREEIRRKVRSIREAGPVVTDMSTETACFLAGAGMMMSLSYGGLWGLAIGYAEIGGAYC